MSVFQLATAGKTIAREPIPAPTVNHDVTTSATHAALPDGVDQEGLRRFETAFKELSAAFRTTFIVEGVPLRQTLNDEQISDLQHSLSGHKVTSQGGVVSIVAAAYDYDCEQVNEHIFLLRKRYTDQNDLPCVTYGEMVNSLRSILDLIDPGSNEQTIFGKDSILWTFYDSLRPSQTSRGMAGLAIAELSPAQRELALAAAHESLIHLRCMYLWDALRQLEHLRDQGSEFTWMKMVGGDAFGYEGHYKASGTLNQFPLNNGFKCGIAGGYSRTVLRPKAPAPSGLFLEAPLGSVAAPTNPVAASDIPLDYTGATDVDRALAAGMLSQRLPSTVTLSELAARYSLRATVQTGMPAPEADAPKSTGPGMVLASASVDDALGEKPICLYGEQYSAPGQVIRAVAAVYGLRILDDEKGNFRIAKNMPRPLEHSEDAGPEIVRLMPAPFIRYWDAQTANCEQAVSKKADSLDARGLASAQQDAVYGGEKASYFPVVRRLLILTLPLCPTKASPPVPIASAPPEVLRLISLLMMSGDALNELRKLRTLSLARCLTDPDSMVFQMRMIVPPGLGGQQLVEYIFGYRDHSGEFVNEGGAGTTRKPPEGTPPPTPDTAPPFDTKNDLPPPP